MFMTSDAISSNHTYSLITDLTTSNASLHQEFLGGSDHVIPRGLVWKYVEIRGNPHISYTWFHIYYVRSMQKIPHVPSQDIWDYFRIPQFSTIFPRDMMWISTWNLKFLV
ncbi:hypothetical protein RCL_jg1978.t1 [Rhizophagus clarus]|uniref:Uncharacterized protein n=1 Tax=Rhizophagus clarus TaxID=94130 RepID=A0A8H3QY72_9GLOM|nr:hypothetical protein RCL_jg1978.t1 [Rhizophagus clarus]